MRNKNRIEPFLGRVKIRYLVKYIWDLKKHVDATYIKHKYKKYKEEIKKFWIDNPDLRFSQVLVTLDIIPNIPGSWYYKEEDEILNELYPTQNIKNYGYIVYLMYGDYEDTVENPIFITLSENKAKNWINKFNSIINNNRERILNSAKECYWSDFLTLNPGAFYEKVEMR